MNIHTEIVILPTFNNHEWLSLDNTEFIVIRTHVRKKLMSKMKPKVGSKLTHVHWFVHMHVMANLFNTTTIHQMPTIGKLMVQH